MCLGVPGKIASISGEDALSLKGKVNFGGISKEISLAYVPEAKVGEYAIVHAGFAISVVDEQEAIETLKYFKELEEIEKKIDEERKIEE